MRVTKGEEAYEDHNEQIVQHDRLILGREGVKFVPVEDLCEARLDLLGGRVHHGGVAPPQDYVARVLRHLRQVQESGHERATRRW